MTERRLECVGGPLDGEFRVLQSHQNTIEVAPGPRLMSAEEASQPPEPLSEAVSLGLYTPATWSTWKLDKPYVQEVLKWRGYS